MPEEKVAFDKQLLDNLSPEERAALDGVDESELAAGLLPASALPSTTTTGDADDADDTGDGDDAAGAPAAPAAPAAAPAAPAEPAAPAAPAAAPAAEPAAPTAAGSAPAPAPAPTPAPTPAPPAPVYAFELPADYEQRKTALAEKEVAIWARHDDGEISREELRAELEKLNGERQELNNMALKAELSRDMQVQSAEQIRQAEINALFARAVEPANGGVDYSKDPAKLKDLDTFLKALAANDANEDKPLTWFLDEAHKRVLALHGLKANAPAPAPADPAAVKAAALAKREPDLTGTDVSLANLPGGQGAGDVGGEFDDILSLEGLAFEDALAAMQRTNPARFAKFQASNNL